MSRDIDLTTRYLGLELPHPFMPGASPLVDDLDTVRRLEDAGAAAIVMNSLFEEQIEHEQVAVGGLLEGVGGLSELPGEGFAEASSYLAVPEDLSLGPDEYLEHLQAVCEAVSVPVIASLNGTAAGRWLDYAVLLVEAGAQALELNVYRVASDPWASSESLELETVKMVQALESRIQAPVTVKLSPFYTSLAHFARRLEEAGSSGLVLFNRFYQPDIDIEQLEADRSLHLSSSAELLLRLRWLAILSPQRRLSLAVTGGVHTAEDAVKALMCGADAIQMVSALLLEGPERLAGVLDETAAWLGEHGYASVSELKGSMNLARCPDPEAFERANYMSLLRSLSGRVQ